MKTSQFLELIRKTIREEVRLAVRAEMIILSEGKTVSAPTAKPTPRPQPKPVRTTPLVQFEGGGMISSLLNETAESMVNGGYNDGEIDPEFGVSGNDTAMFVKDYSAILKRSEELSNK